MSTATSNPADHPIRDAAAVFVGVASVVVMFWGAGYLLYRLLGFLEYLLK